MFMIRGENNFLRIFDMRLENKKQYIMRWEY